VQRAEPDGLSYRDFLAVLMAEEVAHRTQTRIQRCVRRAHFPFLKTIEEFDFTFQSSVRLALLGSVLGPELVTQGHCLIDSGPSDTGKTHLAVAIAYRAIQNGLDARFTTATALIDDLSVATRKGKLRHALPTYTHPHVLVIDEVGYLSYGPDAANVLFHVVNERYLHHRPMIFTTNKPLAAWGRVLHDPDLAQAILDRVLERGRLLELRGPSYRTRHIKLDLSQEPAPSSSGPARISGNHRPQFPEPTDDEAPPLFYDLMGFRSTEFRCGSSTASGMSVTFFVSSPSLLRVACPGPLDLRDGLVLAPSVIGQAWPPRARKHQRSPLAGSFWLRPATGTVRAPSGGSSRAIS
jgi:DNA replication protein DnaC